MLILLPLVAILAGFTIMTIESYKSVNNFSTVKKNILIMQDVSRLINSLQKERGYTSGFLASNGKSFLADLKKQQQITDKLYKKVSFLQQQYTKDRIKLLQLRKKTLAHKIVAIKALREYSKIIQNMLRYHLDMTKIAEKKEIKQVLLSYSNLLFMKEAIGLIRGSLSGLMAQKKIDYPFISMAIYAKGQYDLSEHFFFTYTPNGIYEKYTDIMQSEEYLWLLSTFQKYTQSQNITIEEKPEAWFDKTTYIINELSELGKLEMEVLTKIITTYTKKLKVALVSNILILIVLIVVMLMLGFKIRNSIFKSLKLLSEYKAAVDRSSIVSKTNKKGVITYVNDKFCEISGYAKDELIGMPHNIVRHKDMPKEVFQEMWYAILNKKAWSGTIKNRKKGGGAYIVEATINPILNEKGEIEEFIAIRNDITQLIDLHNELEEAQKDIILKVGDIGETRSQEMGFHVKRVVLYSQILAKYYGLSDEEIKYLTIASPMHDIGKIAIPDSILHKKGKLTKEEYEVMKTHAKIGYEIFKNSKKALLQAAAIIAYEHHEKYDGSGYPRGLVGENIHIYGRITALADVFDALSSDRCYKKAWDDEKVFKFIKEQRGKHFDPKLVDIFFEHLDEIIEIKNIYK